MRSRALIGRLSPHGCRECGPWSSFRSDIIVGLELSLAPSVQASEQVLFAELPD
jgi:hypothetical protein